MVLVVPNSIIIPETNSIAASGELKNHIGMVGRLLFQKNPEMFLRVAKGVHERFPSFKFSLLGEGFHDFLRNRVYQLLQDLDLSHYVRIMKWGVERDAAKFIQSCDIYLLTSHFEGLPFTILEAMASGVPVVATDVEGTRDVITDGENGFLVEDNDVEGLVGKITELIENARIREKLACSAQKTIVERFDLSKNIRKIEEVYANLC
jgi:glycosyltransferase involved in cell wall biosynthesis